MTTDDMELVRDFVARRSESSFATLVSRYTNLVYSAALRQVCDPQLAEEITQAVFILLARKAGTFSARTVLPSWLYRAAGYVSRSALKRELRRQHREQEAYMRSNLQETTADSSWEQMSPLLDEAMLRLGPVDRDALVLRFFEGRSLTEVGSALGASEGAARKRVNRALEKLRKFFLKRGIASTTAVIAGIISTHSVQAAPAGVATAVATVAFAKGATANSSTLTLIKGALKLMAWTKAKTAIVIGVGVLLAAGTTTVTIKRIVVRKGDESWRVENVTSDMVRRAPPQTRILPTKFSHSRNTRLAGAGPGSEKCVGINVSAGDIVQMAYNWSIARMTYAVPLPQGSYDFIETLPEGSAEALQSELKKEIGLAGRRETREMEVLFLKVRRSGAAGLKPPVPGGAFFMTHEGDNDRIRLDDQPLSVDNAPEHGSGLANFLERIFKTPVIDQTGLTQHFSIDVQWKSPGGPDSGRAALKQALLDQLGLELVPGRAPVEMLVIERAGN